ncbi:MAG: sulfite exporter TauE/SafE family protein [Candidatus Omnitrophica bacterium]|nr:sulfite exporter TauE/SafE family protein [Candidatus Omnitrophota bacterium]
MDGGFALGFFSALWLGILTSISPCPLATNVAAIAYIGKKVSHPKLVFLTGALYTVGRTLSYLLVGTLLVTSLLSAPVLSEFLQNSMNQLLGPILIIVGMFLLELISFRFTGGGIGEKTQKRAEAMGIWGSAFLGFLFALSFCPVSAALFFGSLVPLSVQYQSYFLIPFLYGVGTALPVLVFAVVIATGVGTIGKVFDRMTQFEIWGRRITGTVFIFVGIYLSLMHIFKVF